MNKIFILIFLFSLFCCGERAETSSVYDDIAEQNYDNGDLSFENSDIVSVKVIENSITEKTPEEILEEEGWKATNINNGQMSSCYNFTPKKSKIDNSLNVTVGGGTDVVIKLMNLETDKCVRYIFINRNTSYAIRNIPEGQYYLKIAYGKNWYSKTENV